MGNPLNQFTVLFAFALAKVAIAALIVWLGFRGSARPEQDDGFGSFPEPTDPPSSPTRRRVRRRARVAHVRGRPFRSPSRTPRRVRADQGGR